jgi:mannose-6-phosphate isomerase-like protein (cupin superfamily)
MDREPLSPKVDGARRMEIFRVGEASPLEGKMSLESLDSEMRENLSALQNAQGSGATETLYLYGGHGMSLCRAWFKSGYPLPLHSHDADCMYYVIAGSIKLGSEVLGPGDGFVIPAEVPYTYVAGPEGVELLEFRTSETFDIKFMSTQAPYWQRLYGKLAERRPHWERENRPKA